MFQLVKNLFLLEWGLGRSHNAGRQSFVSLRRATTVCNWLQASLLGEGGSPTLSPFLRGRGLGIGIENLLYFYKNELFLQAVICIDIYIVSFFNLDYKYFLKIMANNVTMRFFCILKKVLTFDKEWCIISKDIFFIRKKERFILWEQ